MLEYLLLCLCKMSPDWHPFLVYRQSRGYCYYACQPLTHSLGSSDRPKVCSYRIASLPVSEADAKLLWGRAAGMCSRPGCGIDLTRLPEGRDAYTVGEMAHVIARSPAGPRGSRKGGDDTYANLILLCPTDHRHVDKAPDGEFPPELLHEWKNTHENRIRSWGSEERYETIAALAQSVRALLASNYATWKSLGPRSDAAASDPSSNLHIVWELRRADTIVPNNRKIMNKIKANEHLLGDGQITAFAEFCVHAEAYEVHVHSPIDAYPVFPVSFEEAFANG